MCSLTPDSVIAPLATSAQLAESIENYRKVAAKSSAAGNDKKAKEALESAEARTVWLEEAKKHLAEFN